MQMLREEEMRLDESHAAKTMLIIAQDQQLLEQISRYFRGGIRIECVPDGLSGLVQTMKLAPEIILLHNRAAKVDCADLCRRIRDISDGLLFVISDAGMTEEKRISCFEAGADDVLSETFHTKELMLRIKVLNRRGGIYNQPDSVSSLQFGSLRMDRSNYRAYIDEQDLILTRKEFTILWLLAKKPGLIISRDEMLRRVWGYHLMDDDRMIDTHLNRLRKKMQSEPPSIRIKTVWGIGYKLESAVP
jgi:DNA-binding response OmpR family regulator